MWIDWTIIAVYALSTITLGWYFSRRQRTTEEYFLGGRNMNWMLIGVSLFATLLSTISYLSMPGEALGKGPVHMTSLLGLPLVYVVANLQDDHSVDHAAITQNVRHVVERGIATGQGVLLAVGAGGDFPMLSVEERKRAAETIVAAANERAPVLLGAQDTSVDTVIELAQWAEKIGAYGIQMSAGYYYESSDEDCLRVFQAVHDATRDVAIMIYNTPWEGYNMSLDQVARLAALPRGVALKWSTSDGSGVYLRGLARFAARLAVVDNHGLHVMNHLLGGTG